MRAMCLLLLLSWSTAGAEVQRWSRERMGTRVDVLVWSTDPGAETAVDAAFDEMTRLEALLSEWRPTSEISALNDAAGRAAVPVSPETLSVLSASKALGDRSGGGFDVTWAALRGLWDFEASPFALPSAEARKAATSRVDYRALILDPTARTARLARPGMAVGLGGIAKGYIVDAALELLTDRGFRHVVVSAGGDMAVRGRRGGRPWRVGIQHPRAPGALLGLIEASDEAVVTSGDYERFRRHEGRRYHHILDPRTGLPARGAISVTVVARDAMVADALSTAAFVLGPKRGLALLRDTPNVEGVIVDDEGHIAVTPALEDRLALKVTTVERASE